MPTAPVILRNNFVAGQKNVTTAGTQVVLATAMRVTSVVVRAKVANTGMIYVGVDSVDSSTGFELDAGDACSISAVELGGIDLANIWIDSSVNGEGVTYYAT